MDPRLAQAFESGQSVDFDEAMDAAVTGGGGERRQMTAASADGGGSSSGGGSGGNDDSSSSHSKSRPPRVKVSPFTSSARIEEKMHEENEADRILKLEEAVRELLDLCARNEVDVPEDIAKVIFLTMGGHLSSALMTGADGGGRSVALSHQDFLMDKALCRSMFNQLDFETQLVELHRRIKSMLTDFEVHVKDASYTAVHTKSASAKSRHGAPADGETGDAGGNGNGGDATPHRAKQKIQTVMSANLCYKLYRLLKKCVVYKGKIPIIREEKKIMDKVNLVFESGKMYLVLGAPGSGKSTLLKYIANTHVADKNHLLGGEVKIGSVKPAKGVYWSKLVAYIDQIDRLDAYLTVYETCEFAWRCRSGGTHRKNYSSHDSEAEEAVALMDEQMYMVNKVIDVLGLTRVKDTFVGDQVSVRGISGGEKKRVTCAEMFCVGCPVLCCDEISTGLDAATTFDITQKMAFVTKTVCSVRIVSLLQPPPETVANFDEIVLLSEGKVIFSGPIERIIPYFQDLGYEIPQRMDLADFLQMLPTKDGWRFLRGASDTGAKRDDFVSQHLDTDAFHERFYASDLGAAILEKLQGPVKGEDNHYLEEVVKVRYANPWYKSMKLLVKRELTLWWRNKYQLKAKIFQTLFMGIVVGTVFYQSTDVYSNVFSILFQSVLYQCLGAMVLIVKSFPARSIFYKQQDANFFPTWAYVLGRSLSTVPVAMIDAIGYGSMIFWLTGLAYNDGASIANYFMFMLLLFVTSLSAGLLFGILTTMVSVVTMAQASMAFVMVILVLFSGFTVQPDVIPPYYTWLYWLNFVAWMLRALVVNEFDSGKYSEPSPIPGLTLGEAILVQFGFVDSSGTPFTFVWAWYGVIFTLGIAFVIMFATSFLYNRIRFTTGQSLVTDKGSDEAEELDGDATIEMPFKRVDLTFKDIRYTVKSSISKEKLELLKGVDGVVRAGEMTALMGSSGAGKTTLMDCLALRKNTGEISGEVRLNGHLQDEKSFRRCAGYVEQFDTQTPQLTIKETMMFSAKLRLEESDPAVNDETIEKFVNQTMHMLELTNQQDLQVGSDATGGLSFEQKKRLSIAVELVANPSIIFLDEPTSGLDARAAAVVMRGMRRIASTGRAVCATIHQPSVSIFNDFDSLLLLKRGGEVVYHGELGHESRSLIQYFERFDSTPRIQPGENPATWMLTTIGAGSSTASNKKPFDYAGSYASSKLHAQCLATIDSITAAASQDNLIAFESLFATSRRTQVWSVLTRAMKVYYRSPSYNLVRSMLSSVLALLYATVYVSQRVPKNESDMNSRINSVFMAVLFLCVSAQNTVLGVFEVERNMFYRHKAANMYTSFSVIVAFTLAEIPFVLLASLLFSVLFYFPMGFALNAAKFFLFFMFITFGIGTFTLIGQMLMSLFKDAQTAQGIGALISSSTSLFSGVFIRPENIPVFWIFMYWILPGHWIFEGLFMSLFENDDNEIDATTGSAFFNALNCTSLAANETCQGTVWFWVQVSFPDWSPSNIPWSALYLIGVMIVTRCISFYGLTTMNHMSN